MKLVHANPKAEVVGQDELPGKSNYFIGNDPKKWHTDVPQFAKVRYENVYPGVDLVYYGNHRELEYDFVLRPGANPAAIRLGIEGAKRLRLERSDLVMASAAGDVRLRSPKIYQESNGVRHEIRGGYVITNKNEVGFGVEAYDRRRALVIDPVLAYSTYLGGSGGDNARGVAVDGFGNAYVTGLTISTDFPIVNAIQPGNHGNPETFVSKFNPDGSGLIWSTYLGGTSQTVADAIAVDSTGNAYITGFTDCLDFPTVNAVQATNGGGQYDAFVTKINSAGSALVYSTYLGGNDNDNGFGIAADSSGNAYVTGFTYSSNFPTANAIQPSRKGTSDAFVTKIKADGSAFVYSTFLGGSTDEIGNGIAVDPAGNVYVAGQTDSTNFPTNNAFQSTFAGGHWDAFVAEINVAGNAFVYSTYLGGSDEDEANGIAVDSTGNVSVAGITYSTNFPTANALQPTNHGGSDAFVTRFNAGGTLAYSTYLGGSLNDSSSGVAVDSAGNTYVTGITASNDFPQQSYIGLCEGAPTGFLTNINQAGSALVYSTCWGNQQTYANAVAVDSAGSAYVVGETGFNDFPISLFAFQQSFGGDGDAVVFKVAGRTFVSFSPTTPGFYPTLVFKQQVVGTSTVKKLTMTNQGSSALNINNIRIVGLNSGDFSQTNNCGNSLGAGASCVISVAFTPTDKNFRQAVLGISDSDPASPNEVFLNGTATVVSLSKKKLSFGDQPVGTSSSPQSMTLTNVGNTQLNFSKIIIKGLNKSDFSQVNNCVPSIPGKGSCTITVTFTPTAIGTRKATVYIYDDGGASPQKIGLNGTGT